MRRGEIWTVAGGKDYAGKPRPTFDEAGFPVLGLTGFSGFFAPAAIPKPVADRLSKPLAGRLRRDSFRAAKAVGKPHKLPLVACIRELLVFASGTHWVKSAAVAYWSLAMRPSHRAHVA
jgi:hypothetical protein